MPNLIVPTALADQLARRAKRHGITVTAYIDIVMQRENARQMRHVGKSLRKMAGYLERGKHAEFRKELNSRIRPTQDSMFLGLVRAVDQQQRKGGR